MCYIINLGGELFIAKGRPTQNPKYEDTHVRLDNECETILYYYTLENNIKKSEAIRIAIKKLKDDIKHIWI